MFGLTLIAVLALMGGAIAYFGDKIGTKVGKKKLSMFGLRPKHTSIIVAIATGILITASTLTILTITSRDVRTALFGMENLKNELSVLSSEVTGKNKELEANRLLLMEKEREYVGLMGRVDAALTQLSSLKNELIRTIEQRDRTMEALASAQHDYQTASGDLVKAKSDISALETTKADLDLKIANLSTARDGLKQDVDRLSDVTAKLRSGMEYLRGGTVLYRANEVLATAVINVSPQEEQDKLMRLILETNHKVLVRMGKADTDLEALWISQVDFQNTLKMLKDSDTSVVIRIVASGNSVLGEPVIAHFELYPNRQIFSRGETVASKNINVMRNADNMEVVLQFLQEVNNLAIAKGVLPDPLQGTVGTINVAQLYDTVNEIKKLSGSIELSAIAAEDISVAGPLIIRIQIDKK
jgi:uncharacterized protein (DUF3084 family)